MPQFHVLFSFSGTATVEADTMEEADAMVEEMRDDELFDLCGDGFGIQSTEEVED